MNRNQRNYQYGKTPKWNDIEARLRAEALRNNNVTEIKEVLPPRIIKDVRKGIPMTNRSCYVKPFQRSVAQLTEACDSPNQLQELSPEHLSSLSDTIEKETPSPTTEKLRDTRKEFIFPWMVDNDCQYSSNSLSTADSVDCKHWQNLENVDEIDQYIMKRRDEETLTRYHSLPKNCYIPDAPRIKTIAEKFSKYKKNNIELRKLEEKVVCVEYDVFDRDQSLEKPVQKMRAFFSLKPVCDENKENILTEIPSTIKNKFKISTEAERKLSQTEMEVIDGKIIENRPYLYDLEKILRRRQSSATKKLNPLDLQALHVMANREYLESEFDDTLNSDDALKMLDINKLMLSRSSVHGISRRTLKTHKEASNGSCLNQEDTISRRLVTELIRADSIVEG